MVVLYMLRHGDYVTSGSNSGSLTPAGIESVRDSAKEIKKELNGQAEITVYTSPQSRAKESARIVLGVLKPGIIGHILVRDELDSEKYQIPVLVRRLGFMADEIPPGVILVSHAPDLQRYLQEVQRSHPFVDGFPKGGYARVETK